MTKRQIVHTVAAIVAALLVAVVPTASAQTADQPQEIPYTIWNQPGSAPLDAVGAWMYIAPQAPAGPMQGSIGAYEYTLRFDFPAAAPSQGFGFIGLTSRPEGNVAGMSLVSPIQQPTRIIPFDWVPGQFYYVLVYRSGVNQWIGWIFDYKAASWTIVGRMTTPEGWSTLSPSSRTMVDYTGSSPTCAEVPRTDAYFYPPVGYRGTTISVATVGSHGVLSPGGCASTTTIEYDWAHYRLGADPAA